MDPTSAVPPSLHVVVTDPTKPDNPIVYVSDAFLEITGYTLPEVLGRNCRFLQGPDTNLTECVRLKHELSKGIASEMTVLNYTKSGLRFWNRLVVQPVFGSNGDVVQHVGIQHVVSQKTALTPPPTTRLLTIFKSDYSV